MGAIIVFSTADSMELAHKIASELVEAREAACVNIIPGIRSIYRWEGKLCDEGELMMLIKTSEERLESVRDRIRRLHTYYLPEIIAVPIDGGDPEYLDWLVSNTGK